MHVILYIAVAAAGALMGFLAAALIWANVSHKRRARKSEKREFKPEFSKIVLVLVMATYFVGVIIGVKITLVDFSQFGVLLTFIGTPTATAIVFYTWKAKAENIIKIKKSNPDISPSDIGNV